MSRLIGQVLGIVLLVGLVLLLLKWALITAAIVGVPFGIWWLCDRHRTRTAARQQTARHAGEAQRRRELEALATVDAAGGCGWCGSRLAHQDESGLVLPLAYHRAEIEAQLNR